jgi:pimeloyl-ACP methyl ester carboxylesterase
MLEELAINGLKVAYLDEGKGPPSVLIGHCSSASHKEWLPLIEEVKQDARVLAPDFIGYGRSDPWPLGTPFALDADVAVLTALANKTKGPLHFVGHSYGAALALEAARQLGPRVKSLTLVEPVAFHLLRVERRPEWAEIERLGLSVLTAVARGDDRAAAAAFMGYCLGRFKWWLSPERFKAAIAATIRKVALEITIALDAETRLSDYSAVTAPCLLIVGSKTRAPARAVVDMLRRTLPDATVKVLKGAGHMSPFTHPSELNRLILDHLAVRR